MGRAGRSGVCKLTGTVGEFVASHIIPAALTRLESAGEKRIEAGIGLGKKWRANSWYDSALVTRQGEDILAQIDSVAIEELRAHRLVWSGWGPVLRLHADDLIYDDQEPSFRLVQFTRPKALQLFFLSLLWRAGASSRPEFSDISLSPRVLEDVRTRVHSKDPGAAADYPVQLFQLATRGHLHNRTPLLESKPRINLDGSTGEAIAYVRFYFDGLVGHIHLPENQRLQHHYLNTCLRYDEPSLVFLHSFATSRTRHNLAEMIRTVHREENTIKSALTPISAALRRAFKPVE